MCLLWLLPVLCKCFYWLFLAKVAVPPFIYEPFWLSIFGGIPILLILYMALRWRNGCVWNQIVDIVNICLLFLKELWLDKWQIRLFSYCTHLLWFTRYFISFRLWTSFLSQKSCGHFGASAHYVRTLSDKKCCKMQFISNWPKFLFWFYCFIGQI